jgi:hypothetical protein
MAPPRRKRKAPGEGHSVYLRLPTDVFERIEKKAKEEGRPFNRIIINELAAIPNLEQQRKFATLVGEMEVILARYGSRITLADLGEPVLRAVDEVLEAKTDAERTRRLDKLRVLRAAMVKHEQQAK